MIHHLRGLARRPIADRLMQNCTRESSLSLLLFSCVSCCISRQTNGYHYSVICLPISSYLSVHLSSVCPTTYLSVHLPSVCLSLPICLSICLPISTLLPVHQSTCHLSVYQPICHLTICIHLSGHLFPSICLPISSYLSICHLSTHLSICESICVSHFSVLGCFSRQQTCFLEHSFICL